MRPLIPCVRGCVSAKGDDRARCPQLCAGGVTCSPCVVRVCRQRSTQPHCDARGGMRRMRSWGATPRFTSWAKRSGTTRGERPWRAPQHPPPPHRGLLVNHALPVRILTHRMASTFSAYKITKGLVQKYGPERVIDTPITEAGFTGMAVGSGIPAPSARTFCRLNRGVAPHRSCSGPTAHRSRYFVAFHSR